MVEAQIQNWAIVFLPAISRKLWKLQADVDFDAILMFPFLGDVIGAALFLFEDFFQFVGPGMVLDSYTMGYRLWVMNMGYSLQWTVLVTE